MLHCSSHEQFHIHYSVPPTQRCGGRVYIGYNTATQQKNDRLSARVSLNHEQNLPYYLHRTESIRGERRDAKEASRVAQEKASTCEPHLHALMVIRIRCIPDKKNILPSDNSSLTQIVQLHSLHTLHKTCQDNCHYTLDLLAS